MKIIQIITILILLSMPTTLTPSTDPKYILHIERVLMRELWLGASSYQAQQAIARMWELR